MQIQLAYKTELNLNNAQVALSRRHVGVSRFVWNWALARRIEEYSLTGKFSKGFTQSKQLNAVKDVEFPWMRSVSKCVPQAALADLDRAYDAFLSRKTGKPKFKSKKNSAKTFRLNGHIKITSAKIRLPKLGWIRLKEHSYLPLNAKINSAVVSEISGRWFVSLQVEEEITVPENTGPEIGLDLGLNTFAMTSEGRSFYAPKPLKNSLKQLQRLSKRHSKKQKGSQNRKKASQKLAKLHYRISCQRSDFLHKTSSHLAKTKSVIVVEDLSVKGMLKNRSLSRAITDVGWSEFLRQLKYKTEWYGSKLVVADRFYPSTKTCSGCGAVKDTMALSERTYSCEYCGLVLDRDLNAAKNLLSLSTAGSAGSKACGDLPGGGSGKQELNSVVLGT